MVGKDVAKLDEQKQATQELVDELYQSGQLFRPIDTIRKTAKPLESLWGYFLFKKAITSVVGDPGVCKTTMGYGLAKALCLGETFLDIAAEEPVNVLYMDFESADSLIQSRGNLVIGNTEVPNFIVYNSPEFYLMNIAQVSIEYCKANKINLVIIDNQTMAFNTRDENDNAEASRQMRLLRSFANASNAAVLIFHHSSKANLPGTRKGTGAYARARLSDICLNIDTPDEDNPDIIRLETVKNRIVDENVCWFIRKKKGKFILIEPPLGITSRTNTVIYKVQQALLELMKNGQQFKRKELVEGLASFEERTVQDGIDRLKQLGRIKQPEYGYYAKAKFT
jgi:predicted ATP-dependent serine protease